MSQLVWNTTREARSGWYQTTASMHFTVEIPRLYAICDDPASWPLSQPRTRTLIDKDQRLGYAFDNDTKVEIEFAAAARSIARVTVTATHLHNEQELLWAQNYWQTTLERMAKRTSSEPVIAYSAPGKLNLFFKVGPLRQDGYHDVASIYQAVNLRETVIVEHSSKWQVEVTGNLSAEQLEAVPTGEENLVVRAAKAVAAAADIANPIPVHFSINKQVPVAGGMGGGSADAAAAILAVNDLWKANLPAAKLLEIAASIGADVPFALRGGLAIGRGNGDRIEVVKQAGEYHWVLVLDETGLSTPVVFGRLDELRTQAGKDPQKVSAPSIPSVLLKDLREGASAAEVAPLLHNDLQAAAISLHPKLQLILNLVQEADALTAVVSGSGPTVAFLAGSAADAIAVASRLRTRGLNVIITSSPAAGAQLVQ